MAAIALFQSSASASQIFLALAWTSALWYLASALHFAGLVNIPGTGSIQGGPAKVKPNYFTHQNAQMRYYSTVLFYKKNR